MIFAQTGFEATGPFIALVAALLGGGFAAAITAFLKAPAEKTGIEVSTLREALEEQRTVSEFREKTHREEIAARDRMIGELREQVAELRRANDQLQERIAAVERRTTETERKAAAIADNAEQVAEDAAQRTADIVIDRTAEVTEEAAHLAADKLREKKHNDK